MTKRNVFLTRIIATIVTLAMVFTLLAVPASAASVTEAQAKKAKAIVSVESITTLNGTEVKLAITKTFMQGVAGAFTDEKMSDEEWADAVKEACEDGEYEIYSGSVPSSAYVGYVNASNGKVIWLGKEDFAKLKNVDFSKTDDDIVDWDKGTITMGGQTFGIQTGSADGGALLIVGGVLAAAGVATAAYFYTHPDAWKKTVDTVQTAWNNVTTPVQNAWNSLVDKIPTKEAVSAENEAAENEAAEPAEQTEQTQAAA